MAQWRTHHVVNEISTIGETAGGSWADPVYCDVGNMTIIPTRFRTSSSGDDESVTAVYDAWNRLVRLMDAESDRIAEYEYDGRNFRIIKRTFDGSSSENLTEQRHSYYNSQWQLLEERVTNTLTSWDPDAADPERIYMWGKRYIDDLILRKRSSSNNGTFDEKRYAIQDANFNVIGGWPA